jgi:hypothetical protein
MKSDVTESPTDICRRSFIGLTAGAVVGMGLLTSGCQGSSEGSVVQTELPPSSPDPESPFGVDLNINMSTIDGYVGRSDIAYRDVRMIFDSARYDEIGGNSDLDTTIEGFKIAPWPHIGSLPPLPVEGGYEGDTLFSVVWDEDMNIVSVEPNYSNSMLLIEEIFPKDMPIFIMCGGGGYAAMTKIFLTYLGWDASKLYVVGPNWEYTGDFGVDLIRYDSQGIPTYYLWRAECVIIDFQSLEDQSESHTTDSNKTGLSDVPGPGADTFKGRTCTSGQYFLPKVPKA